MNDASPTASRYANIDDKIDSIAGVVKQGAHIGVARAEDAMQKAGTAAKAAADSAAAARDKLASCIESRPLTSVIIAFGIGALLGRMLRR